MLQLIAVQAFESEAPIVLQAICVLFKYRVISVLRMWMAVAALPFALETGPVFANTVQLKIDKLFGQMRLARTEAEAGAIQSEIHALWRVSGSDTADLLLVRTEELSRDGDTASAAIVADAVVDLYPEFAEGWFRRAQLRILRDEGLEANRDLLRALQLEPKHFLALEFLGRLYEEQQESEKALDAFRQYLAINPLSDSIRQRVTALERGSASQSATPGLPPIPAPRGSGSNEPLDPSPPEDPRPTPATPGAAPDLPPI